MLKSRRPCNRAGCPGYQYKRGLCEHHYRQSLAEWDARRGTPAQRGYDAHWRKLRNKFLQVYPRCMQCGYDATEVHHVIPLAEGGDSRWENLQALCKQCHSRITATAVARAEARARREAGSG